MSFIVSYTSCPFILLSLLYKSQCPYVKSNLLYDMHSCICAIHVLLLCNGNKKEIY